MTYNLNNFNIQVDHYYDPDQVNVSSDQGLADHLIGSAHLFSNHRFKLINFLLVSHFF